MQMQSYDSEVEPLRRNSFLTTLCILTFIGSGWTIINSIVSYTSANKTVGMFAERRSDSADKSDTVQLNHEKENSRKVFGGKNMRQSFSKMMTVSNIRNSAIGKLIDSLLTLAGALLMWGLRRKGFYLYILGIIVGIAVPFFIYGNNFLAVGLSSFGSFFGLVFIALYALNYKSLVKK